MLAFLLSSPLLVEGLFLGSCLHLRTRTTDTLTELPPQQQATHVLIPPEGLLGNKSLLRKSLLSRHGVPQPAGLLPYPSGQLGQAEAEGFVSLHVLQLYLQSHIHLLPTERKIKNEARCHPKGCASKCIFEHMGWDLQACSLFLWVSVQFWTVAN